MLARAGLGSRRACEGLIRDGVVAVNGRVVAALGTRVEADDRVTVRGRPLRAPERLRTFMLNKPREVVSTASDPEGRRTVLDFLPDVRERVYPVGRLDYHSEGLILLTNDGDLAERLLHPRYQVTRVYLARIRGVLLPEEGAVLARGLRLDGKPTGPIRVRAVQKKGAKSETSHWVEVTVREGRYHLVREALLRVGHPVSRLRRVSFGSLRLGRLATGEVRELDPREIAELRAGTAEASAAKRPGPTAARREGRGAPQARGAAARGRGRRAPSS